MKKLIITLFINTVLIFNVQAGGYSVGDKATDFKLKNVDGKFVSLADYKNAKGFIVIFTCNRCPYVVASEDRIIALDKEYKPQGYPVITINPNDPEAQPEDSYDKMQVKAKEKGFTFPYLFDDGQKVVKQYGATRTPHVYLLKREKDNLVVKYIGAIDNNPRDESAVTEKYLENAMTSLLANKEISPKTTKAIGCTVKYKK